MIRKPASLPAVLSVAGSDNSAGAGIQADLKTLSALGCYGLTAVTCVVAEVPGHVESVHPIPAKVVGEQIRLVADAFPLRAAKTGMLYSRTIIRQAAEALRPLGIPLVVDPVMIATGGHPLLKPDAVSTYWTSIFPMATVITPNLDELAFLTVREITSLPQLCDAAEWLAARTGRAVLAKGGHLPSRLAIDVLVHEQGIEKFEAPRIRGVGTHGTGCTYSAAIAAALAHGHGLVDAVSVAKSYITSAIAQTLRWPGSSTFALRHFVLQSPLTSP